MATAPGTVKDQDREIQYRTRDGRPIGETEPHRKKMVDLIDTLEDHFALDPNVYVSGNLLVFYERGNRRKHLSLDVFVVRGVPKLPIRDNYLIWREGKAPEVVIEITPKSTRREDERKKSTLYRDVMKIPGYFLFDPTEDYLKPHFQGFRLEGGEYMPITPVAGRLPSEVLGLHLERSGVDLRLYDPRRNAGCQPRVSVPSPSAGVPSTNATSESASRPRPSDCARRSPRSGTGSKPVSDRIHRRSVEISISTEVPA
jgi:Uma2 family endonuclease